jgi:hypothetical protein
LSGANYGYQFAEKRLGREHRIRGLHRVAAGDETLFVAGQKSVQKKPALVKSEDDLTVGYIVQRAGRDLRDVIRPDGWQHACAAKFQAQLPSVAQSFYSQSLPLGAPTFTRIHVSSRSGTFSRRLALRSGGADLSAGQRERLKNPLVPECRLLVGLFVLSRVFLMFFCLARGLIL